MTRTAATDGPMRLILAARLSQKRKMDKDGKPVMGAQTGLDTQDIDGMAWAKSRGHTVIKVVPDVISGRVPPFRRKNLAPWFTDQGMAQYDGILFSKMDRATRGRDWGLREWAERTGKKIIIASPELIWPPAPGDTQTPMIWDLLVNLSSAEWEETSKRYKRMQRELRESGYYTGRSPYGFVLMESGDHKILIPDLSETGDGPGDICREIFNRYDIDGWTISQITADLMARGVPAPIGDRWWGKTVAKILRNPVMAGRPANAAGETVMRVAPLVQLTQFDRVNAKMDKKATRKGVATKRDTAMLISVVYCGKCGSPLYKNTSGRQYLVSKRRDPETGELVKTKTAALSQRKVTHRYYCYSGKKCRTCIPINVLDAAFDAWLHETLPGWQIPTTVTVSGDDHRNQIDQLERDAAELNMTDPDFIARVTAIRAEVIRLTETAEPVRQDVRMMTGAELVAMWDASDLAGRRAVLTGAGVRVDVHQDDDGTFTFAPHAM